MTEPERTERYRGPLPGEVPLSRDSRAGGVVPGLSFDDVTGRVVRTGPGDVPAEPTPEEPGPAQGAPGPQDGSPSGAAPARVPDAGPSRTQRRTDDRAMVPLLARALSAQLARLAADDDPTPDGWWFAAKR